MHRVPLLVSLGLVLIGYLPRWLVAHLVTTAPLPESALPYAVVEVVGELGFCLSMVGLVLLALHLDRWLCRVVPSSVTVFSSRSPSTPNLEV